MTDGRERFEALVPRILEPLRRYLARRADPATAQDVLSEVLLVVWRRLPDVPVDDPLPWVYTVARNCLSNAWRSQRRQERLTVRVARLDPMRPTVDPHHETDGAYGIDVHAALGRLNPTSAEMMRLWAWEQLTAAQIAVVLDTTPNAVSVRLHRAKKELAALLPGAAGGRRKNATRGEQEADDKGGHR